MTLWMQVTMDEYELPLAVADSIGELGKMIGKTKNAIYSSRSIAKRNGVRCCYVRVDVDDGED